MTQCWTIVATATGTVLCPAFVTDSFGQHPKDKGWAWDAGTQLAHRIDRAPDPLVQSWNGTAWVDEPAKVEALLIAALKAEAELRKMEGATSGGFKKTEYAAKRAEVIAWDGLGSSASAILAAFDLLPDPVRAVRFEYALADAAAFGDAPADAIARFRAGIARATRPASVSAVEAKMAAAIRAAGSAAAKRAVAATIDWPN